MSHTPFPIVTAIFAILSTVSAAQSIAPREGLRIPLPNGYANVSIRDLRVQSAAGPVSIRRYWNGFERKSLYV